MCELHLMAGIMSRTALLKTPGVKDGTHPLKVWVLCLYFMGLNLSNEQIGQELALNGSDVQQMTAQLREGIVKKRTIRLKARVVLPPQVVIMLW